MPSDLVPVSTPQRREQRYFLRLTPAFAERYADEVASTAPTSTSAGASATATWRVRARPPPSCRAGRRGRATGCPGCVAADALRATSHRTRRGAGDLRCDRGAPRRRSERQVMSVGFSPRSPRRTGCSLSRRCGARPAPAIGFFQAARVAGSAVAVGVTAASTLVTPFGAAPSRRTHNGFAVDAPLLVVGALGTVALLVLWSGPAVIRAACVSSPRVRPSCSRMVADGSGEPCPG